MPSARTAPPERRSGAPPAPERRRSHPGGGLFAVGAAALALGGLAVANQLLAQRSEARHPPRGRALTVDGVRLHLLDEGAGPPVVLLHGNGVSAEDFRVSGLLAALARSHRVLAIDRPGFGYSERPARKVWTAKAQASLIFAALEALAVDRPLVVAHSWGCFVALQMALQQPRALAGLVLMSGYYRPTFRPDAAIAAGPALPVVGALMRYTASPIVARLLTGQILRRLFAPAPVSETFRAEYPIAMSLRPSHLKASAAEAGLMRREAARLAPELPRLAVPALVIAGRNDRLVSFSHQAQWLAAQLPGAQLAAFPGAGHMVHHTASAEVLAAIARFEARVMPPRAPDEAVAHA